MAETVSFRIHPTTHGVDVTCELCKAKKNYAAMPIPKADMFKHASEHHGLNATAIEQTAEVICPRMYVVEVRA